MFNAPSVIAENSRFQASMSLPIVVPEAVAVLGQGAATYLLEFFLCQIRNRNTREAYERACLQFFAWMAKLGVNDCRGVEPLHVAAWVEAMQSEGYEAPTVMQRLAAIRMLFDWLVSGGIVGRNAAAGVKGPKHKVHRGKTPVLEGSEAAQLLDAIPTTNLAGLRDRAIIGLMTYSFARVGAVVGMSVGDVFHQQKRLWVRLHEKGGHVHEMPCNQTLEKYLADYLEKSGLKGKRSSPLFPSFMSWRARKESEQGKAECQNGRQRQDKYRLTGRPLHRLEALAMVKRRAKAAGLNTAVVNHTFRCTGITNYLKNGGDLERARLMANHASIKTTQLYDRRSECMTVDDVERICLA
jgi:site-specific recombinase XerD